MRRSLFARLGALVTLSQLVLACAPAAPTGGSVAPPEPEPTEIVMAFTPSSDPNALLTQATPITDYLSRVSGLKIKPFITTDYTATIEAMTSKKVDVAWLAPTAYVLAHDQNGAEIVFKAMRRDAATGQLRDSYYGTIVVAANSGITRLADLKGKRIAFVDPASTSGYLYPAALLLQYGIDPKKDVIATFAGAHDAAALAVYQGNADAAATFEGAAEQLLKARFPDVTEKLKEIARTDPIPNDGIAFRKDLPASTKEKLKQAILRLQSDPEAVMRDPRTGNQVRMLAVYRWDGIAEARDSDFDPIRVVAKGLGIPLKELVSR
ncbi:MAG: phosphonate ABC transporter substrate-binding protein [Dehalococcoidia bacterium]|nr:MAG: phosphonate ABC transporter substrate-binding protein [Dehalococcoidia bacterium]